MPKRPGLHGLLRRFLRRSAAYATKDSVFASSGLDDASRATGRNARSRRAKSIAGLSRKTPDDGEAGPRGSKRPRELLRPNSASTSARIPLTRSKQLRSMHSSLEDFPLLRGCARGRRPKHLGKAGVGFQFRGKNPRSRVLGVLCSGGHRNPIRAQTAGKPGHGG